MRKIRKAALFVTLAVGFAFAPFFPKVISASAGSSRSHVASETSIVGGRINTGDFMVSGGVYGEGNQIVFDTNCTSSSKIIGKTKINNLGAYGVKNLLEGKMSLQLNALVENSGVFSICFGLESLSSKRDGQGVVEMRFYEDNGVNFVVYEHCSGEISNELLYSRQYTEMQNGGMAEIDFLVTTDGLFSLVVNGTKLIDEKMLYEGGDGYFAIFSEGKNEVKVGELSLFGYSYDTPENVNYTENFDNEGYNANVFYSMSNVSPLSPSYLTVEDGALKFSNTAGAHITTRYAYSNFEMAFDVTELQRTALYDENGNIEKLISNWFSIAFGVDNPDQAPESTNPMAVSLQLEGMPSDEKTDQTQPNAYPRLILWDKGIPQTVTDMPYNIWDASKFDGKIINIKFSICDGEIKLWMKTSEESWGEPVFAYDLGYTPSGYVRLFTWGQTSTLPSGLQYNSIANFTIDNLSIKNTDYEDVRKILSSIEYKSNYIPTTPNFDYTTKTDDGDLLGNRLDEVNKSSESGCGSAISCSFVAPLVCTLCVSMIAKGGKRDE